MGSPANIDPDSGTTPDEHLAAVREEVSGRATDTLADGSTVYRGRVAARLIARETGFKDGESLRVLPSATSRTTRPPIWHLRSTSP